MNKKDKADRKKINNVPRTFKFMPILDFYVLREYLIPFTCLLFAFCLLFFIGDVFRYLGDFLDSKASFAITMKFFFMKMPGNIRFIFPITVLLGCMYTLANFGRHREITAMRASGISLFRCAVPIYIVAFLVSLVNFWFNEAIVPYCESEAVVIRKTAEDPNYERYMNQMLQYRSNDKKRDWLFQEFSADGTQKDVILKVYEAGSDASDTTTRVLKYDLRATEARYIKNVGWEFINVSLTPYTKYNLPGHTEKLETYTIPEDQIPEKPATIANAVRPPEELPTEAIYRVLQDNKTMAPSLRNHYSTLLYYRLAFPWISFLCVFLALPLAAKNERSGIFVSITSAVVIIVGYQVLTEIFLLLGKQGILPPVVGGLTPTIVFAFYGWFFLIRKAG